MATGVQATGIVALLSILLTVAACGHGGGNSDVSYPEGRVRMEIEMLDTGLLKGHSYAEAGDDWSVAAIKVEATDPKGARWPVIEPEFNGLGSNSAKDFFEVTLQELPRGEQIVLTATVAFKNQAGKTVNRTSTDRWPP